MERVRIRSMLKNLKNAKACMSARNHIELEAQNLPDQSFINMQSNQKNNILHKTHHSFTIEPIESILGLHNSTKQTNEVQIQKSNFSTLKQNKKKSKILNRSFMIATPVKNIEISQNLKELGIKKKQINNRSNYTTDKHKTIEVKVSKYLHNRIPQKPEVVQQMRPFSVQRRKSMPDNVITSFGQRLKNRNKSLLWDKDLTIKIQKNYPKINFPSRQEHRKSSDICAWQIESPMYKVQY